MAEPIKIQIPLINPNEPEAIIVDIFVKEGDYISKGDPLCTLETTKSTQVVNADQSGFVRGLRYQIGQFTHAGDVFCYLADSHDWQPPDPSQIIDSQIEEFAIPDGMRITEPALALIKANRLNVEELPTDLLITEAMIKDILKSSDKFSYPSTSTELDPSAIIVYGGGGHGKAVIDLLRTLRKYHIVGIVDDGLQVNDEVMGIPVIGGYEILSNLYSRGIRSAVNAVGGIGNMSIRIEVFKNLDLAKFICPTVIHPSATIEASATLSSGIQVFPNAYVGSQSKVGYGVIVNTSAIVSHDCVIGDYTNVSPGAILAGEVKVGAGVLIGMGATINLQVRIGHRARIGNGATVKSDVPENGIVRAGSIWPP